LIIAPGVACANVCGRNGVGRPFQQWLAGVAVTAQHLERMAAAPLGQGKSRVDVITPKRNSEKSSAHKTFSPRAG
jgi:hypothetical protein